MCKFETSSNTILVHQWTFETTFSQPRPLKYCWPGSYAWDWHKKDCALHHRRCHLVDCRYRNCGQHRLCLPCPKATVLKLSYHLLFHLNYQVLVVRSCYSCRSRVIVDIALGLGLRKRTRGNNHFVLFYVAGDWWSLGCWQLGVCFAIDVELRYCSWYCSLQPFSEVVGKFWSGKLRYRNEHRDTVLHLLDNHALPICHWVVKSLTGSHSVPPLPTCDQNLWFATRDP